VRPLSDVVADKAPYFFEVCASNMDVGETLEVNAWVGKPPEKEKPQSTPASSVAEADDDAGAVDLQSMSHSPSLSPSASSHESDLVEIPPRPVPGREDITKDDYQVEDTYEEIQDDTDELQKDDEASMIDVEEEVDGFVVNRQNNLVIKVPQLAEEERDEFDYLPNHFTAKRILYALPGRQYIVKLGSGEVDLVSLAKS